MTVYCADVNCFGRAIIRTRFEACVIFVDFREYEQWVLFGCVYLGVSDGRTACRSLVRY